jgi:hypothetical protein
MKVFYSKGKSVVIYFPAKELKQALGVLKAMGTYFKADFIWKAAQDLDRDLQALVFDGRWHLCENCACEIDTRNQSYIHVDDTYYHQRCPELKENRPL